MVRETLMSLKPIWLGFVIQQLKGSVFWNGSAFIRPLPV